ncbi:P-loop containing nucleoside triphosphate hydrolase protein, partial [Mycena latifolia]
MPTELSHQIRLTRIIAWLTAVVPTLKQISNTFNTPFLEAISSTTLSLTIALQTVRKNRTNCIEMMERIHALLYGIIDLHLHSEPLGELTPHMLHHIAKFAETLYKIHAYVEAQHDRSRLKQFFRQGEMNKLLKDCTVGLQQALDTFKVQTFNLMREVADIQHNAKKVQEEVLELITSLTDGADSDNASSIHSGVFASPQHSSTSLSMLPSEPKIFHGRESELGDILKGFARESPRVAILGPGGIGKTSLARAVLHHPDICFIYDQHRFFVVCDTVSTRVELAGAIGSHLGLKSGTDLTHQVLRHFSRSAPCLLVLDNLDTCWEPVESRRDVEEFLSLLTDIPHLGLVITMRGEERPAQVRWTRPFLPPLKRLAQKAARATFIDIADDFHDSQEVNKLLHLPDNVPLAIDLMAHLVAYEGCPYVLSRWEEERTSLLSEGSDRRSNLDLSISLSLSSPRITSLPHSHDLLSLLSLLPDGISDGELLQSKLPIDNILTCKAALLGTSLAYIDDQRQLNTLVPIREYVQKFHPPGAVIVHPLLKHF